MNGGGELSQVYDRERGTRGQKGTDNIKFNTDLTVQAVLLYGLRSNSILTVCDKTLRKRLKELSLVKVVQ